MTITKAEKERQATKAKSAENATRPQARELKYAGSENDWDISLPFNGLFDYLESLEGTGALLEADQVRIVSQLVQKATKITLVPNTLLQDAGAEVYEILTPIQLVLSLDDLIEGDHSLWSTVYDALVTSYMDFDRRLAYVFNLHVLGIAAHQPSQPLTPANAHLYTSSATSTISHVENTIILLDLAVVTWLPTNVYEEIVTSLAPPAPEEKTSRTKTPRKGKVRTRTNKKGVK